MHPASFDVFASAQVSAVFARPLVPSDPMSATSVIATLRAAGCVFAEDEARLLIEAAATPDELAAMIDRRVGGEPLEHILGWVDFFGMRIGVDDGVFVPRRRSEFLVRTAALCVGPGATVVDLCCGSGALGVALASVVPIELHSADLDSRSVACARRNVEPIGGRVFHGDLFDPLPGELLGSVDVVIANAPYVPTSAIASMPPEARDHEPRLALDGGDDGVDVHRRIVAEAPRWLRVGGSLLIETSEDQAPVTASSMAAAGLVPGVIASDDGFTHVVRGIRQTRPRSDLPVQGPVGVLGM